MHPDNSVPTPPAGPNVPQPPQLAAAPAAAPWLEPPVPVHPAGPAAAPAAAAPSDPQLSVVTPAVADDGDLIEKEWVMKAKQIVERTRMNPHEQVKQMHAFKADYMKKRYNKVIEPVEE